MESLRELYRIGYGPSSSHTMGPRAAAEAFIKEHPEALKITSGASPVIYKEKE